MPFEQRLASGQMELYYENDESASGHRDQSKRITLKALDDGKTLHLSIELSDSNAYKGTTDTFGSRHFKITVDELVKLLAQHGQEWYPPPLLPPRIPPQRPLPKKFGKKLPPK